MHFISNKNSKYFQRIFNHNNLLASLNNKNQGFLDKYLAILA